MSMGKWEEDIRRSGVFSEILRRLNKADTDIRLLLSIARGLTGLGVSLDTSAFNKYLSAADTDVQKALDTLDDHQHLHDQVIVAPGLLQTVAAGGTSYMRPYEDGISAGVYGVTWNPAGTIRSLAVATNNAQPATGSLVITVEANGVATTLTVTIPAGSPAGTYVDNVNTPAWVAGSGMRIKLVNNAPAAVSAQIRFVALSMRSSTL